MSNHVIMWANLALAFALELCGLAALGYWGAQAGDRTLSRVALGVGSPLLGTLLWGLFVAPRAPISIPAAAQAALQAAFFVAAAVALRSAGHPQPAAGLLALALVNTALSRRFAAG